MDERSLIKDVVQAMIHGCQASVGHHANLASQDSAKFEVDMREHLARLLQSLADVERSLDESVQPANSVKDDSQHQPAKTTDELVQSLADAVNEFYANWIDPCEIKEPTIDDYGPNDLLPDHLMEA